MKATELFLASAAFITLLALASCSPDGGNMNTPSYIPPELPERPSTPGEEEDPTPPTPQDPQPTVKPSTERSVEWTMDFDEEFDGTSVNTASWGMYNGEGHAGNGLRRPEAFSVEDGILIVTASMKDGQLVSGGMAHNKNYLPGKDYDGVRFEFKAKCDPDPSKTTSGVILTWPGSNVFPDEGEMDIFETLCNASRKPLNTFIHYSSKNSQVQKTYDVDGTKWQEMALEWFPDALIVYLNGVKQWTVTKNEIIPKWRHHLCIQLDAFGKSIPADCHLYVDYVHIYTGKFTD